KKLKLYIYNQPLILTFLGVAEALQGKYNKAAKNLARAVEINGNNDVARSWWAYIEARRRRTTRAIDLCREVLRNRKDLAEPYIFLALALKHRGEAEKAIQKLGLAEKARVAFYPARAIAGELRSQLCEANFSN
ncbi:MAG: hypothetical protein JRJ26_20300, partial [Deltaproteobacteria bacterium]|nr:hypothetical protein [Deltaproteobacteria bacterium]